MNVGKSCEIGKRNAFGLQMSVNEVIRPYNLRKTFIKD